MSRQTCFLLPRWKRSLCVLSQFFSKSQWRLIVPNNFAPKRRHKTENKNKQKKKKKRFQFSLWLRPPKLLQNKEPQNITMLYINFSGMEVVKKTNKCDGTKNLSLRVKRFYRSRSGNYSHTKLKPQQWYNKISRFSPRRLQPSGVKLQTGQMPRSRFPPSTRSVFRVFLRFSVRRDETLDSPFHPPLKYQRVVTGLAPNSHQGPSLTAVANLCYQH